MIRPRGGDFCYTELEREIMFRDIEAARRCGMDGIVFGVLQEDGQIDAGLAPEHCTGAVPIRGKCRRVGDESRTRAGSLDGTGRGREDHRC